MADLGRAKNEAAVTFRSKDVNLTWERADWTWEQETATWAQPEIVLDDGE